VPTVVVKSIGTAGGRDYSTLQAWEDACPADLVAADQVWKGECYNDSEFTSVNTTLLTISGITTDATRYVWLSVAAGHSFADHASKATNPLRYDASKGVGIRITGTETPAINNGVNYSRFSRFQVYRDAASVGSYTSTLFSSSGASWEGLLVQTRQNLTGTALVDGQAGLHYFTNCALIALGEGPFRLIRAYYHNTHRLRNCTILKASDGGFGGTIFGAVYGGTFIVYNTAIFGQFNELTNGAATFSASSDRVYTSLSSLPAGTNHSTGLTAADQFVAVAASGIDARPKSSGALPGAATRDAAATNDLDIIEQARSTTTPTIGAFEYISAEPPPPPVLLSLPDVQDITASSARLKVTITYP
jgi:hypothetical protein